MCFDRQLGRVVDCRQDADTRKAADIWNEGVGSGECRMERNPWDGFVFVQVAKSSR